MLKLTDLIISPKTLGSRLWLTEISPCYSYKDGKRTNNVNGFKYTVAMLDRGLEKISVKISGPQRLDEPTSYAEVEFDDLELFIYWMNGQPQVGARAKDIRLVNRPNGDGKTDT